MIPNQGLFLEQKQKLLLTPELKQALKILQMPILELSQYMEQELEENPFLEVEEDKNNEDEEPKTEDIWDLVSQDWDNGESNLGQGEKEPKVELWQKDIFALPSLREHLREQLFDLANSIGDLLIGQFIIDSLDNNGYFVEEWDKIVTAFNVEKNQLEKVLSLVQTFEPKGVGARNLQECLLLQLDSRDLMTPLAEEIIKNYLDEVSQGRIPEIAKKTKFSLSEVQEAIDLIKSLNPRPGNGFRQTEDLGYIFPDLTIRKIGEEYQITVNEKSLPSLVISPFYRQVLKNHQGEKEKLFVEEKLKKAMGLLKNIEQRRLTILKVAEAIFQEQRAFLEKGYDYLKPLTQKEIAQMVDLHESTISRVVNSKYCQTPWGVFPLNYFFPNKINNHLDRQEELTSDKIKKIIKKLIEEEDKNKPLSDQKIQDFLEKQKITLARRTIAKYREELGIPSSSKRKRY